MGVYGLWRLFDATGKQVPLETLEGKVLAIDISIWIHQVLQGYQDRFGNPKPNAHLIGLFHRICKLLYYKIKPIFVFDGGVPILKKDTIALRRKQKSMAKNKAQQMRTELINNLIKHSTVKTVLNPEKQNTANGSSEVVVNLQNKQNADDMFKLPNMPSTSNTELNLSDDYDSDSPDELSPRKQTKWIGNIHNVDVTSTEFKALPADVRYEILTDLKETRKQSSWGRLHEMPEESNEFSGFQMKRLLKRRLVQQSLEYAEKEMGGKTLTLDELDKLLKEQGITTNLQNYTYRIAADSKTRLIYINDKNAYLKNNHIDLSNESTPNNDKADEIVTGPSKITPICDDINEYDLNDDWDSDIEITAVNNFKFTEEIISDTESEEESNESRPISRKYFKRNIANPAVTYMLEYSGLTEKQILTIFEQNNKEISNSVENVSEVSQPKTSHHESKNNLQHLTPEDNKEYMELDSTGIMKSIDTSNAELSESNVITDINLSPTNTANISNKVQVEPKNVTAISSTDSDSDDFIEIEDTSMVSEVGTTIDKYVPQQCIQITFKSDDKVENDIFADVFETRNNELNVEVHSQNTLFSDELPKQASKTFLCNREISESEIAFEKTIVKSTKDQVIDKQLFNIEKMNDVDVQSNTNAQSEQNQMKDKISIESVTNSPKCNIEATDIRDNANINMLTEGTKKITPIPMTEDELQSLQAQLEDKQIELMANIGKLERQGIDISDQIRTEAQELLQLFGIPYVVAPMEAEAQCAYLEQIQLTDGTITDDSDIWLFGGQCVYKNFFDNNKKVLEFRSCDIQHHFKLTRKEMIQLALLVGSDYTTGLPGIGPVTALEILAAFPSEGDDLLRGLTNFCSWIETGKSAGPGKTSLRNKLQNLQIQKGFPSQAVAQAYLSPKVDESKETFSWGKPNVILLANYAKQKFGWDKDKYNKIMAPVLKRLEEKQTQNKIDTYFKLQTVPKSIEMNLSKRVQKAVQRLNNENIEDSTCVESVQRQIKKKKSSNENRKKKGELKNEQTLIDNTKLKASPVPVCNEKNVEEYIPQRENDKANALKNKLHAIEVLRKSKQGLYKTKKVKRCVRKVKEAAQLSESDSGSS